MKSKKIIFFIITLGVFLLIIFLIPKYKSKEYKISNKCYLLGKKENLFVACNFQDTWNVLFQKQVIWEEKKHQIDLNNYKILTSDEVINSNLNNLAPHEGGANLHERIRDYLASTEQGKNIGILATDTGDIILRFKKGFREYTFQYRINQNKEPEIIKSFYYNIIY